MCKVSHAKSNAHGCWAQHHCHWRWKAQRQTVKHGETAGSVASRRVKATHLWRHFLTQGFPASSSFISATARLGAVTISPNLRSVEIRPQTPIGSGIGDMLNFEPSRIQSLIEQGRADTLKAWEKVQRPLHAISKLRQSIDSLATSERAYEALDAEAHDAMTRIRGN